MCKPLMIVLVIGFVVTTEEGHPADNEPHYHSIADKEFWLNTLLALFFCCMAGFCSGNTVGLLSIDPLELEIRTRTGTQKEKIQAEAILSVVHNHHLLLVTLLLYNAIAMESLPLVIHTLVPAWAAILISTIFVLIVGQIIPQALCTGPNKLAIAQKGVPLIKFMIKSFWIISYPMAKGLDYLLGDHGNHRLERKDLAQLLNSQDESTLQSSQILLLGSILKLREYKVNKILIPLNKTFMVDADGRLDSKIITNIKQKQYSFVPVYRGKRSQIVSVIKSKELVHIAADPSNMGRQLIDLFPADDSLLIIYEDTNLMELLMLFEAKRARIAFVGNRKKKVKAGLNSIYYSKSDMVLEDFASNIEIIGMASLNNVFEMLIGIEESTDEATKPGTPSGQLVERQMDTLKRPLITDDKFV